MSAGPSFAERLRLRALRIKTHERRFDAAVADLPKLGDSLTVPCVTHGRDYIAGKAAGCTFCSAEEPS